MKEPDYEEAQKKCRLTDEEVQMAKRLHISARSLIRCAVSGEKETWKDVTGLWVRRIYEKDFQKQELLERNRRMQRIGKKADKDPVIAAARHMGFTRSECCMVKDLELQEEDLQNLYQKAKSAYQLDPALLVRRMSEKVIGNRQ